MGSLQDRFEALLEANRRRIEGIARGYAGADAEDLVAEIIFQLWRSLPGFEGRSSEGTWVYRVAINTAISWRRRAAARPARSETAPDETAAPATTEAEEIRLLESFLASLSASDRAVFLLYLDDLTHEQIAEVMGLTASNVGVKLHRMKKRFLELIGGEDAA